MKRKSLLSFLLALLILFSSFQITFAENNITEYNMELKLNAEERILEGKQEVVFVNTYEDALNELVFHLYPDSYSTYETLPAIGGIYIPEGEGSQKLSDEEKGYIDINKVCIDGEEVEYTEENQILKISLFDSLKKGEKVKILIEFTLKIPTGYHRLHYMEDVYSLTNWYPVLSIYDDETDSWDENPYNPIGESNYSHISNYNIKLTVPKDMVVAPTGTIVEEIEDGDEKIVNIKAENVRDFVIIMSPKFKTISKEVDGIKIVNYYMIDATKDTAQVLLDEVAKTVKFMNKTFGKYPYDELKIVETYLSGGAMEYPQVIQMGTYGYLYDANPQEAPWQVQAAVHETIHQWWYVSVGNNEYKEPFLDESLTVFTTAYYFEKEYGKYHGSAVDATIRQNIFMEDIKPLNSSVEDFEDWGEYSSVIYNRAPAFFEDLRHRVGEEKFVEILKTYFERYMFKNATIERLLDIIEEVAGKDAKEAMKKAVTEPNYYPANIELTQEEEKELRIIRKKQDLTNLEKRNGLIIGSIILRALNGERVVLVKPENINEKDLYEVENLIGSITNNLKMGYDVEIELIGDKDITEDIKKENLIVIGYPEKSRLLEEMVPHLPIKLNTDTVEVNKITIENDNVSGMFISKNPYNEDALSLIIFLGSKEDDKNLVEVRTSDGIIYIYEGRLSSEFNPLYNYSIQFIIDVDDIQIQGMYN